MVSENKKTIQITPELLGLASPPKAKRNKTRKNPPTSKKNPLKQALMNKIKEHAKKNNKTLKQHGGTASSEIDNHMNYLMNLEKKQKIKINTKLPKELEKHTESTTAFAQSQMPNIITVKAAASKNIQSATHSQSGGETPNTYPPSAEITSMSPKRHAHTPQPRPPTASIAPPVGGGLVTVSSADPSPIPTPTGVNTGEDVTITPLTVVASPSNGEGEGIKNEKAMATTPTHSGGGGIAPEPAFGNLKGGKKPTYRQWYNNNKTLRRRPQISMPKERVQEVKRSYNLGKSNKTRKVSILLKNKEKRREIQDEINSIKREKVVDIKKYLRNHNIIKSGSTAPHDVLRQLYQQSRLAGGINNKSNENVIHNYLAEGDEDV